MAIGDLKRRLNLKARFLRRHSTSSTFSQSSADGDARAQTHPPPSSTIGSATIEESEKEKTYEDVEEEKYGARSVVTRGVDRVDRVEPQPAAEPKLKYQPSSDLQSSSKLLDTNENINNEKLKHDSISTVDFPTPSTDILPVREEEEGEIVRAGTDESISTIQFATPTYSANPSNSTKPELSRRQSLLPSQQTRLIETLLETDLPTKSRAANFDYFANQGPSTISANMVSRKIWVKRLGQSATLVTINEDDLVDDVRDMILKKYANSLGRSFDSPDVTLRIVQRDQRQERALGPEEPMSRTLDAYFPGGQTVDEALVIDVPLRRTPKPSPQPQNRYYDEQRPVETGSDYFPPMPMPATSSPHLPVTLPINGQATNHHATLTTHSMSVLTTGHVPALPSPGSTASRRHHRERPRIGRQHTSSPTVMTQPAASNGMQATVYGRNRSRTHSSASEHSNAPPVAPPLPTPPAPSVQPHDLASQIQRIATPPPRISSPRPSNNRPKRSRKLNGDRPSLPAGMLNGAVPPINVLIVEDNIINLKLLEAFMKRLKVRWQTAMNGREAVNKWRAPTQYHSSDSRSLLQL